MATPAQAFDRHHVPRMIEGLFVGPGQTVSGMPSRLLSAVLPVMSAAPTRDSAFICLDLYQRVTDGPPETGSGT